MPRRLHHASAPQQPELRQVLGYLLAMASIKTTQVFETRVEQAQQLRRVEYTILEMLSADSTLRAHQLARRLNFTRPSTSAWLDKLETKGLLMRQRDDTDKRADQLTITAPGRTALRAARQAIRDGEAQAMAMLTPAEQAMLKELLAKFAL